MLSFGLFLMVAFDFCLNFALSDSEISKNDENSNIADDTGNGREQIHLHGTKT